MEKQYLEDQERKTKLEKLKSNEVLYYKQECLEREEKKIENKDQYDIE